MPEISRFFGIVVKMFFNDHGPPHFHAQYGEHAALVDIRTLFVFSGSLPPRPKGLVVEWATLHQQELLDNWEQARACKPLRKIAPLDQAHRGPARRRSGFFRSAMGCGAAPGGPAAGS